MFVFLKCLLQLKLDFKKLATNTSNVSDIDWAKGIKGVIFCKFIRIGQVGRFYDVMIEICRAKTHSNIINVPL